jgi:hypothetical protein
MFNISDDSILHNLKREISLQVHKFDLKIEAKGFFTIDRKYIAAVTTTV